MTGWVRAGLAAALICGVGGCTIDLIDDAISNEMQVRFLGADQLEIRADAFRSQAEIFAAADEACGVPASPISRKEIPGDERAITMGFRCERPAPFPPLRDNTPVPEVLRQPRN